MTADYQLGLRSENVTHLSNNEAEIRVSPLAKQIRSEDQRDF
jgi:hypothetical protein